MKAVLMNKGNGRRQCKMEKIYGIGPVSFTLAVKQ